MADTVSKFWSKKANHDKDIDFSRTSLLGSALVSDFDMFRFLTLQKVVVPKKGYDKGPTISNDRVIRSPS